jgi:hypothetical protein
MKVANNDGVVHRRWKNLRLTVHRMGSAKVTFSSLGAFVRCFERIPQPASSVAVKSNIPGQ